MEYTMRIPILTEADILREMQTIKNMDGRYQFPVGEGDPWTGMLEVVLRYFQRHDLVKIQEGAAEGRPWVRVKLTWQGLEFLAQKAAS